MPIYKHCWLYQYAPSRQADFLLEPLITSGWLCHTPCYITLWLDMSTARSSGWGLENLTIHRALVSYYHLTVDKQLFYFDKCTFTVYVTLPSIILPYVILPYNIVLQCINPPGGAPLSLRFCHLALVLLPPVAYCASVSGVILTPGTGGACGITPLWSQLGTVKASLSVKVVGGGVIKGLLTGRHIMTKDMDC